MKCDEIFAALAMLEKERGISQTFMMDKIVKALTTAYKRDHEGVENVVVDVDEAKRDLKMYVQKEVVEEVENPGTQMSLDEAKAVSVPLTAAGEEAEDGSVPAHFDKDYLDSLSITDLKKLAGDLGVAVTKGMKKDDLVAAITAETVTVPASDDAQPDFGED